MLLAADSGSTKCDWVLIDKGTEIGRYTTVGFNPLVCNKEYVLDNLNNCIELFAVRHQLDAVHFYGAGCSGKEQRDWMKSVLEHFFYEAVVTVDSDRMAAVLATCGNAPGIVCILGTGSNSCQFDGVRILPNNFGLGYVLADEGAGTYLGKQLITSYLYGSMPDELRDAFSTQYKLTKEDVITNVYSKPGANTWLAGFAGFLVDHKQHGWVKALMRDSFEAFFKLYVCSYSNYRDVPVHVVGSIGWLWQNELREVAIRHGVQLGRIIRQPIDGLSAVFSL
jgi:glucosamine kinase